MFGVDQRKNNLFGPGMKLAEKRGGILNFAVMEFGLKVWILSLHPSGDIFQQRPGLGRWGRKFCKKV